MQHQIILLGLMKNKKGSDWVLVHLYLSLLPPIIQPKATTRKPMKYSTYPTNPINPASGISRKAERKFMIAPNIFHTIPI